MFYLVFKPSQKRSNDDRVRYDYRSQAFIGFTQELNEAVRLANERPEANYQIYECESPTLDFRRSEAVRYGFRRHYGMPVFYRRTPGPNGQETIMKNPLESGDDESRRLEEIRKRRLEGVQKRIHELQEIEKKIQTE